MTYNYQVFYIIYKIIKNNKLKLLLLKSLNKCLITIYIIDIVKIIMMKLH